MLAPKPTRKMTREFYMPVNDRLKQTYEMMRKAKIGENMKMKKKSKFKRVLKEFKKGDLHSGSSMGPIVTNPKQAIAIAYSEKRRAKRKK